MHLVFDTLIHIKTIDQCSLLAERLLCFKPHHPHFLVHAATPVVRRSDLEELLQALVAVSRWNTIYHVQENGEELVLGRVALFVVVGATSPVLQHFTACHIKLEKIFMYTLPLDI